MLFSKIVVAYDGSEASTRALDKAIEFVRLSPQSTLDVIHVFDYPRFYIARGYVPVSASIGEQMLELAEQTAAEARERLAQAGIQGNVTLLQGPPAELILEFAGKHGHDAIIIGSRGLGGIREFVLGSVSHNVVQHAKIPVMVVK